MTEQSLWNYLKLKSQVPPSSFKIDEYPQSFFTFVIISVKTCESDLNEPK